MDVKQFVDAALTDERYLNADLNTKIQVKNQLLSEIQLNDDNYRNAPLEDKMAFDKSFSTKLAGFNPEDIQGDDVEANTYRDILADVATVRGGGESSLTAWDGMIEGGRNYLTGKVLTGIIDIGVEGNLSTSINGSRRAEIEEYRKYVYEKINPESYTDYTIGKVLGHVTGFAADAALTGGLYGSVGKAGLLTKPLAKYSSKLLASAATKTGGSKALTYLAAAAPQAAFEAAAFIGEEALVAKITGQLDSDPEITKFIGDLPSTALQGLAYFTFGEALGSGMGKALKSVAPVFTGAGYRAETQAEVLKKPLEDLNRAFKEVVGGDGSTRAKLNSLRSHGWNEDELDILYKKLENVRIMQNPENLANNPDELNKVIWQNLYGMDTEKVADGIRVTTFNGKNIAPQHFSTDADLNSFLAVQMNSVDNASFELASKLSSTRNGKVSVTIETTAGVKSTPILNAEAMSTFRPANSTTDLTKVRNTLDIVMPDNEIKLIPVDDYFSVERLVTPGSKNMYIPTSIKNSEQSAKFADQFFKQAEVLIDGNVKFETSNLKYLLKNAGDVAYDSNLIKRLAGKGNYNILKDEGGVNLLQNGEVIRSFTTESEAARYLHMEQYTDLDVVRSVKQTTGLDYQETVGGKVQLSDEGTVVKEFETLTDLFDDPSYRPKLPFNQRPAFMSINMGGNPTNIQTFTNGKRGTLVEQLKAYADTDFNRLLKESENGTLYQSPTSNKVKVKLGKSGLTKEFDNATDALKWLDKDMGTWKNITSEAEDRGYRVFPHTNGYQIASANAGPEYVKTLDEVAERIGKMDDTRNMNDIIVSELDPDSTSVIEQEMTKHYDFVKKNVIKADEMVEKFSGRAGFLSKVNRKMKDFLVPTRDRIEMSGDIESTKAFDKLVGGDRAMKEEYSRLKSITNAIYHGRGRDLNQFQIKNMGAILTQESDPSLWNDVAKTMGIELSSDMQNVMASTRSMLDQLGTRFGVDPATWVDNYTSRVIKKDPSDMLKYINQNADPMKVAAGDYTPEVKDEFFKNLRTEDIVAGTFETDLEMILDSYIRSGLRKQYLTSAVDDINRIIKEGTVDSEVQQLLAETSMKVNGNMFSNERAQEMLARIEGNRRMAKKILAKEGTYSKLTDEQARAKAHRALQNDYNTFTSNLVTSALMSFKMKMPIRNISQVFTMLAPIGDAEYVAGAMKSLDNLDTAKALYKDLTFKGIIKPRDVRKGLTQGAPVPQQLVSNLNSYGMNNFYNSDDFTRMIASKTASDRFRGGLDLLGAKELDFDGFMKFMKVDFLGESDKIRFAEFMSTKQYDTAETFIQRRWTDMTMFDYDSTNKPKAQTFGVGKLFGQYSTYSLSHLQLIRRGIKAEGATFILKNTLAMATVAAFYENILNVGGMSYHPVDSVMFSGGPMLVAGADMVSTLNGYGGGASKASDIVDTAMQLGIPMYGIGRSVFKGMQDLKEAEYLDGFTRMLGATPADDDFDVMDRVIGF